MNLYRADNLAFRVLTRVVKSGHTVDPDIQKDIVVVAASDLQQLLKESKKNLKALKELVQEFAKMLTKPEKVQQSISARVVNAVHRYEKLLKVPNSKTVTASSSKGLLRILEQNLGVKAINYEQRQAIKQMRELLPSIKNTKRREAIEKEIDQLAKELDQQLAKFHMYVEKVVKGELIPKTLQSLTTRLLNALKKKSVKFKVARYMVPSMVDNNTIRFASYVRIMGVPSVTDPSDKRNFTVVVFIDVDKNNMQGPKGAYIQVASDYLDPRDLKTSGPDVVPLTKGKTQTAVNVIHNYLLSKGYSLLKPIKGNAPLVRLERLPKWLAKDVKVKGRTIKVEYRVGSHPKLGDRHPGAVTGKVRPRVVFDGEHYYYEGDDANLIQSSGGWFYRPTRELVNDIFLKLKDALTSRMYYLHYNPSISTKLGGKMNERDYTGIIPLVFVVQQKIK